MTTKKRTEGYALLLALFSAIVMLGAVTLVFSRLQSAKKGTDASVNLAILDEACKAGIDVGIKQIWGDYLTGRGNTTGNLASYLMFVDEIVHNNEDINGNNQQDGTERDWNGNGDFEINPAVDLGIEGSAVSESNPYTMASGAQITSLRLVRTDDSPTGVRLTFTATATMGGFTRNAQQTVRVSGTPFQGFQYAVLANNINCILCHAKFLNNDLKNNTDASKYGTFDRIKVACLESLLIRPNEADSTIAGTLYTRGKVYNNSGSLMSAANIAASQMYSYPFSSANGKISQNSGSGALLARTALTNVALDANGVPVSQFGNLYMNYPSDKAKEIDGELPSNFPSPFPDDNGDRMVNEDEFVKYVNSANGSINFELPASEVTGTVKAGVAYGVPKGTTYTGTDLPTASNSALSELSSTGSYEGNMILVGTEQDPIVIDNKVAINGDVVIKGPVKGRGQLMVSGNVYVMGDVTYADASGKFGEAADGTENAFALTAGGNILMGDYLTNRAKNNYTGTKAKPKLDTNVWQGQFIRTDVANKTVNMSNSDSTAVGYFDAGVVDAGQAQPKTGVYASLTTGNTEGQYSFTTAEIMLFNRQEFLKSRVSGETGYNVNTAIPGYKPRYYGLRDGSPVYQYLNPTSGDLVEHAVNYSSPGVTPISATELAKGTVLTLNPSTNWMSEDTLRKIWYADEAARRAKGGTQPWKFDGLLYTNNSIFGVVRSKGRHGSATDGQMTVRGAIVAADLGLLITNGTDGLTLYYDRRVNAFLNVEDPTQVVFQRLVFQVCPD